MTKDEYNLLFHQANLNLVAFKPLMQCDEEVLHLVNMAIAAEREACAKVCEEHAAKAEANGYTCKGETFIDGFGDGSGACAAAIRARGEK